MIKKSFEMAESKLPFVEGAAIHGLPMFCGLNYQFWKIRMQIFIESIDKGIWDAIVNGPYNPKCVVKISRWTSLGVNRLMKKGEELNMIEMPRTSSLHL